MRTIRINPRFFQAFAALLALSTAGVLAAAENQEKDKKPPVKEPANVAEEKKAAEAGDKTEPARNSEKRPETAKRPEVPARPRPPHSQGSALKPTAWLGIAMREVPQALRDYLDLTEGFGVQVEFVSEGSPAADAGLKVHDVLTKLDDQLLTSPEHMSVLVRSKKKGDTVVVTFLRKGREQTAEVKLGERELPPFSNEARGGFGFQFHQPEGQQGRFEFHGKLPFDPQQQEELQQRLREYQGNLKQWLDQKPGAFRFDQKAPEPTKPNHPPKAGAPEKSESGKPSTRVKPIPPLPGNSDSKPPSISVRPGYPLQLFGANGVLKIDNPKGEVTITRQGGDHKITIKNTDGETVFNGPYDSEKGVKGLPQEARDHLKEMKLDDLKLLSSPPSSKPGVESDSRN